MPTIPTTLQPLKRGRPPLAAHLVQIVRRARQAGLSLNQISFIVNISTPTSAKYSADIFHKAWRKPRIVKPGSNGQPKVYLVNAA